MNYLHTKRRVIPVAALLLAAGASFATPTDNLSSDYRNYVLPDGSQVGNNGGEWAAQLGPGAGRSYTSIPTQPNWRSSVGIPIAEISSNISLGESIAPPTNWDGNEPVVTEYGGKTAWIDYAKKLIATQAGTIEIEWRLKDSTVQTQTAVVSASPQKRPVRLYWTHARPSWAGENVIFRSLQNAGPTVQFGTNYRVDLYGTDSIRIWRDDGDYGGGQWYSQDDGYGYVRLNGTELQALEGSIGTFLIVYSRMDEATNQRVMLAYEVVNVMEPVQTQIDVAIGGQLRPLTRNFDTNELFPQVTRGLTDESESGEIYVYQHVSGKQKNYLWAIRDSSANPWKIEVFWRAKEELDVVWPFEVDIYAASWDPDSAQVYVRDTESALGGEAQVEPVVYFPTTLGVTAMDYQVPEGHMHIESGALYTDWADEGTYALLKCTSGDTVWFQTVRSVPAKNSDLLKSMNLDLRGVYTNKLYWTEEGTEPLSYPPDYLSYQCAILGQELRAPFSGDTGFFYPGWINRNHEHVPGRFETVKDYPFKNPYNPDLYAYPTEYKGTNDLYAPIYPVNSGYLQVWWSLPSKMNMEPRAGSGNVEKLSTPIFFPCVPLEYTVQTPEWAMSYSNIGYHYGLTNNWNGGTPQIVLASGMGSAGYGLNDWGVTWNKLKSKVLTFGSQQEPRFVTTVKSSGFSAPLSLRSNDARTGYLYPISTNFTVECWVSIDHDDYYPEPWDLEGDNEYPVVRFYARNADGSESDSCRVAFGVDKKGNLYVNGVNRTGFDAFPEQYKMFRPVVDENMYGVQENPFHFAVTHDAEGVFRYYLNGNLVKSFTASAAIDFGSDVMRLFMVSGTDTNMGGEYEEFGGGGGGMEPARLQFCGRFAGFRVWRSTRTPEQVESYRYLDCDPSDKLVVQYTVDQVLGGEGEYDTWLEFGRLVDSSGHGHNANPAFDWDPEDSYISPQICMKEVDTYMMKAFPGLTFPTGARIYRQNDPTKDGYNPNEEHALMIDGIAHALRCDLNRVNETNGTFTSLPYVLIEYGDPDRPGRAKMAACRVVPENDMYRFRRYKDAGQMFQSPDPLARFQPANLHTFLSGPLYADLDTCFKDRKGWYWAHQAGDDGGTTNYVFEFSYPSQASFDYVDGSTVAPGTIIGWMSEYSGRDEWYLSNSQPGEYPFPARNANDPVGTPIDYTFVVKWPDSVPKLYVNDTLHGAKDGLPAVRGQLSAKIAYQQSLATGSNESVRLIDPTRIQYGSLKEIPDSLRVWRDPKTAKRKFTDLPPYLQNRFVWNPNAYYNMTIGITQEMELSGKYIGETEFTYAWLNVLDARAKETLTNPDIVPGGDDPNWQKAIQEMSEEPVVLADDVTPFDSMALATTGKGAGYVTLVFNDSTNLNMVAKSEVITMYVIKVMPELYNGLLHVIQSDNPLDKQMNMKYTSDFGGRPQDWEFEWNYCEPVNGTWASNEEAWRIYQASGSNPYLDWVTIGDEGVFGLEDHYVRCRYRALNPEVIAVVGNDWSDWCTPKLAEGWIKRVLKAINPFDQRIKDFMSNPLNTQLSMIQQAGAPYQGDIPLNIEALDENGLIQIYMTLLNQAKKLSIDDEHIASGSLSLALQMAAGRICELYTVLGNEALADAMNPTVDLGADSPVADGAESSIFPFMNQCESLLEEELALLRGRDLSYEYARSLDPENAVEPWAYPYYNRLQWNFTADIMGGQVAYTLNYGIRDVAGNPLDDNDGKKPDGTIDVYDAASLYPQGHGDAWGHYLSALKGYYYLLRHKNFAWRPQVESILAGQTDITISYLHEKRFAAAAEAKARTGEKIVADTYRLNYRAGEADSWLEAEDDDLDGRAWGTDEWASRAHLGAYYDWAMANALLPSRSSDEKGLVRMIDRESTYEIGAIAASAKRIQSSADYADSGLNPLGISDNAVPFDISPSEIDAGKTHFEQIYERAAKATKVAHDVFQRIKGVSNALRDQNASADFENMVADEEAAINRRLIEIYGYPYADDIGPGKTYPQGYMGPDLYHYYYIETYDLDGNGSIYGRYLDVPVDDYKLITTNVTGTYQAEIDESLADYGFLGNIVVGAITWYQDKLSEISSVVDPWTKYAGITTAEKLKLPVAVIDTSGDNMDGAVDYDFHVAAWSNANWVASYFVSEYGFTPKPPDFHGQRKAEGEVQIALGGYAEQLAEIDAAAARLQSATSKLCGLIDELTALDYTTQMGYVTDAAKEEVKAYTEACQKNAETVKQTLEYLKDIKSILTESGVEAFPKLVGTSCDMTSVGRAALLAVKGALTDAINGQIGEQEEKIDAAKKAVEEMQAKLNKQFETYMSNEDRQKKIAAINEASENVKSELAKLEVTFNAANQTRMRYAKIVAEGDELQAERERLRIQWAADLSQSRYRNMMYQILRNDELQRYNEAFELAAKYTFLAARAYDYETGMLKSDSSCAAGSEFMGQIVKTKALGRFSADGSPLGGGSAGDPGLADILYRLDANWGVLKPRLGFNNPQADIDSFSLRTDLFGKSSGAEADAAWRQALADCWTPDLRQHPAFRTYCQPFDPMNAVEPGFVIPFKTSVAARRDLFGNDLSGGSTAYSSTYFATKLRAVGVWLEGAGVGAALPKRPEVYLVPAGLDYMRVPVKASSGVAATRTWQVVEQVLPVPYALDDSSWESSDWSALKDIFSNELCVTRRHPAIRASTGASFDENSTMTYNSRLVGRSVWNDQWYMFIPAASLNSDDDEAKRRFLDNVKDIHLNLKTYSFSGN